MSRSIRRSQAGGPDALEVVDVIVPSPGRAEVRIRVKAIGISRAESIFREGEPVEDARVSGDLGCEAAGIIDEIGRDVVGFAVGDAVNVIPSLSMRGYATYGEIIVIPQHALVKHPDALSFAEGASIWTMFVTAYGALIEDADVTDGDVVLISAASSSVGIAAIQVANYAGATTIALTRTSARRNELLEMGAAHVIVAEESDVLGEVMRITGGRGVRVIFDSVGGASFGKLLASLSFGGTAYIHGALAGDTTTIRLLDMVARMTTIKAHSIWHTSGNEARRKAAVAFVLKGLAIGALQPVIDRSFKFEQMAKAHRYLEDSHLFGKIVVTL